MELGEKRSFELPCSLDDPDDCQPLPGHVLCTTETVMCRMINFCTHANGRRGGCQTVDALQDGPALIFVTAFFKKKRTECNFC